MIQTADVKNYLRIPGTFTDDDSFITSIISAGYNYLSDAIDGYAGLYSGDQTFAGKADMWVLTQWVPPMYDQREGMFMGGNTVMNYSARAMLTQLQLYVNSTESEDDNNENSED